jgi:MFS family permease
MLTQWRAFPPDAKRYLINAGLYGFTLDGGISTVLFNLYMLRLGLGPETIGLVAALGMFVFALTSLPAGRIGERVGLRRMMIIGVLLSLIGISIALAAASVERALLVPALLLAQVFIFIGLGMYYAIAAPFLMQIVSPAQRTPVFSMQSAVYGISGFAGSIAGGALPALIGALLAINDTGSPLPYRWALALIVPGLAVILLQLLRMRDPGVGDDTAPGDSQTTPAAALPSPARLTTTALLTMIAVMGVIRFLQVAGIATGVTFFNVYLDKALGVPTSLIGLIQAVGKLIGVPASLAMPALSKRMGHVNVTLLTCAIAGLAMVPIALIPVWWVAALGYILIQASTPIRYTAFTLYTMERTPPSARGSMNGTQEMMAGFSFALLGYTGGLVIAGSGYTALFLLAAALTLISVVLLIAAARRYTPAR